MEKLKNDIRTDKLDKFDGEGIRQKEGNKIKIKKGIKEKRVGSDKSMEGIILHKVSSFNDAGNLNSISE